MRHRLVFILCALIAATCACQNGMATLQPSAIVTPGDQAAVRKTAAETAYVQSTQIDAATANPNVTPSAIISICNKFDTVDINHKAYVVQNNVWNDVDGSNCLSVDNRSGAFTVTTANHNKATNGSPAAYPSIFKGCHWGNCTDNSGMPVQLSVNPNVTTSWSTTQPGSGVFDVAYDIWFNTTPTTSGQPNGAELMIWLNKKGGIQPVGSKIAGAVSIAGAAWDVWEGNIGWNVISYVRTTGTASVSNLNVVPFINDGVSRGFIQRSWYLITIEAGFELWVGGAGLNTNSFSANVGGGDPAPT